MDTHAKRIHHSDLNGYMIQIKEKTGKVPVLVYVNLKRVARIWEYVSRHNLSFVCYKEIEQIEPGVSYCISLENIRIAGYDIEPIEIVIPIYQNLA